MARPSDKEILNKLISIRDSAKKHNQFKIAAKFEIRIKEFKKKKAKKNQNILKWI